MPMTPSTFVLAEGTRITVPPLDQIVTHTPLQAGGGGRKTPQIARLAKQGSKFRFARLHECLRPGDETGRHREEWMSRDRTKVLFVPADLVEGETLVIVWVAKTSACALRPE